MKRNLDLAGVADKTSPDVLVMTRKFEQINHIELALDDLVTQINTSASTRLCQKIKLKINQAYTMLASFPQLMVDLQKETERRGNAGQSGINKISFVHEFIDTKFCKCSDPPVLFGEFCRP